MSKTLQDTILALQKFWADRDCLIFQPYNSEVGAGTFNPATFLKVLDDKPWKVCYVELSKRPRDGRYGDNPLRVQQYLQLQVILKPAPEDSQELFLKSLEHLGIDFIKHDIRFVEDDWESPTLGAWGLGWQVELDGIEITQFTYFQQMGGLDLKVIPLELTYGLERICMFLQDKESIFDVNWNGRHTWGDLYTKSEKEFSYFNFEGADVDFHKEMFSKLEKEVKRLLDKGLILPAYDAVIKCSHIFNILEARGAISVSERTNYIARVRRLAKSVATTYIDEKRPFNRDRN